MRTWTLALALALVGCGGEHAPRHRAVGTLIRDGLADDDRAGWATELEIVKSARVLGAVERSLGERGVTLSADAIRRGLAVQRRAASRILEVSVALDDGPLAQETCNRVLRAYQEQVIAGRMMDDDARAMQAAAQLDALRAGLVDDAGVEDPGRRAAYEQAVARERERAMTAAGAPRGEVRLLDDCRLVR